LLKVLFILRDSNVGAAAALPNKPRTPEREEKKPFVITFFLLIAHQSFLLEIVNESISSLGKWRRKESSLLQKSESSLQRL